MADPDAPAAYQGRGWRPRRRAHEAEVRAGLLWRPAGVSSEWGPLEEVMLHVPPARTPPPRDVNAVQHLAPVDFAALAEEIEALAACYHRLGIEVDRVAARPPLPGRSRAPLYNLVFVRDLFVMTPEGAVVARMASEARAGEERHVAAALASIDVPIVRSVVGSGTFEGADALWLRDDLLVVGVGQRTNAAGFEQVRECVRAQGRRCVSVPVPAGVQHLMGAVQAVDRDLALVRGVLLPGELRELLTGLGFTLVELPEGEEVRRRQAMNVVTVGPRRVLMAAGCPESAAALREAGVTVVEELRIAELAKAAGGLGCATGVVRRAALP
jgi:N-dimethylarginine dimethylaminohydrolase